MIEVGVRWQRDDWEEKRGDKKTRESARLARTRDDRRAERKGSGPLRGIHRL